MDREIPTFFYSRGFRQKTENEKEERLEKMLMTKSSTNECDFKMENLYVQI